MKRKKYLAVLMAGIMAMSLAACGDSAATGASADKAAGETKTAAGTEAADEAAAPAADGEKLVIWTLADDLNKFGAKYQEETGVTVEVVTIEQANYPTKVQTALLAGEKEPDIIVGEPQMLEDFYDAGFFADLDEFGAKDYEGQIVDYIWELGQSDDGVQRAISYQVTPAGIYYRRDIAREVFGTDDPDEIGKLFADYDTILSTAEKLKSAGYRIFASDSEISYFTHDSAWVVDNTLNVTDAKRDYMDLCIALYQQDLVAYAAAWSTPWRQAMVGEIPILTADIQSGADDSVNVWNAEEFAAATEGMETTTVFAFGLPSWGVITMRNSGVTEETGEWGICSGPAYGFGGGTFIGISSQSDRKELAWDFVKFCTLNEETANWWIEESDGDVVSLLSVLEAHKDDENSAYSGQKTYAFWQKQAEGIDTSTITRYDTPIGEAWAAAISAIKTGQSTREEALDEFYNLIESTYPELTVNRE